MKTLDFALLTERSYTDAPTVGRADSASRMHVYHTDAGDVHVFRGSDDVSAWLADFDITTTEVWGLGKVHAGFWNAYSAIMPGCLALPRPIAVAGHSLGAGLTVFHAFVLAQLGCVVPVYAFEPPRMCADGTMAALLKEKQIPWYACRNGRDIVTQVPPAMTLPGPLTEIGHAVVPFDNATDHGIGRVVAALTA